MQPLQLELNEMYSNLPGKTKLTYRLHSMFCYYGQHYHAFIHKGEQEWVMFDDAQVSNVGSWKDVITKCTRGRIQPLVLFYKRLKSPAVGAMM